MSCGKNCEKKDMLLYAVTDRSWLGERKLAAQVEECLEGGVTFLQLREKALDEDSFYQEALEIQKLCRQYHVPFIINDNVEIALRCDADGVHVGQSDMKAQNVREKLGPDKIIGVSAQTVEQAMEAEAMGADYLGVGAVFSTSTKLDAKPVAREVIQEICKSVSIPVVAIGGINEENLSKLSGTGVDGVAVVSAIFASEDITSASRRLRRLSEEMVG
ncbi:MAG: thiamine phosphate synthase [Clostridia bacterium]|nr:thiamine phosphate synthase [Clostridia bacterium]NCC42585.1 thiamine phosphate synthase [Clostridia bacterium]